MLTRHKIGEAAQRFLICGIQMWPLRCLVTTHTPPFPLRHVPLMIAQDEMTNLTSLLSLTTAQPGTTTPLDIRSVIHCDLEQLQEHVLHFLHAAAHHQEPLEIVEGAMLLLEQLSLMEAPSYSDTLAAQGLEGTGGFETTPSSCLCKLSQPFTLGRLFPHIEHPCQVFLSMRCIS